MVHPLDLHEINIIYSAFKVKKVTLKFSNCKAEEDEHSLQMVFNNVLLIYKNSVLTFGMKCTSELDSTRKNEKLQER